MEVYPALLRVLGVLGATGSQLMRSGVGGRKRGVEPTGRVKRVPRPISGLGAEKEDNWVSSLKLKWLDKKAENSKTYSGPRGKPTWYPQWCPHILAPWGMEFGLRRLPCLR